MSLIRIVEGFKSQLKKNRKLFKLNILSAAKWKKMFTAYVQTSQTSKGQRTVFKRKLFLAFTAALPQEEKYERSSVLFTTQESGQ